MRDERREMSSTSEAVRSVSRVKAIESGGVRSGKRARSAEMERKIG